MSNHLLNIGLLAKVLAIFVITGFIFLLAPATASAAEAVCSSNICSCEIGTRQNCTYDSQNGYSWECVEGTSTKTCPSICGDNQRDFSEECDGADLGGQTCQSQGYDGGVLSCNACSFDTSNCSSNNTPPSVCGDGNLDVSEECDGADLGGQTCQSQGYDGGVLSCNACSFDTSSCSSNNTPPSVCGDGNLDVGEECDWPNLNNNVCEDFGYVSGDLLCNSNCKFDFNRCVSAVCGDGVIDYNYGEQCEVNPLDLDGQSCETLVGGTGNLNCKQESCTFNTNACVYCGNQRAEGNEECDGIDRRGQTCESLGYGDGLLGCSGCKYLVDDCTGSQSQCLNGVLEGNEQCEFPNQFKDNATCDSLSNGKCSGVLACNNDCSVNNSRCFDNLDPNKPCDFNATTDNQSCQNEVWSPWTSSVFDKPDMECGDANADPRYEYGYDYVKNDIYPEYYDEEPGAGFLCKGNGSQSYTPEVTPLMLGENQIGWKWKCGEKDCKTFASAKCRSDLAGKSNSSLSCAASGAGVYATYNDYRTKLDEWNGNDRFGEWNKFCAVGYINFYEDINSYTGKNETSSCTSSTGDADFTKYNSAWSCTVPGTPTVYCSASWLGASLCGSENNKEYKARERIYKNGKGYGENYLAKCSASPFWKIEDKPEQPNLCAAGSYLVPGSMRYLYDWSGGFHKDFVWQCQWKREVAGQSTQFGTAVDCKAKLNGYCKDDGDGKCGNDEKKFFPTPDGLSEPGKELCELGTPVKNNPFLDNNIWKWKCESKTGGKTDECSTKVSAICGDTSNGFANEVDLRNSSPCRLGSLSNDRIYSDGSTWYWYCIASNNKSAYVRCEASKCGYAGEGTFSENDFNTRENQTNFLCNNNGSATNPVLTYDNVFQRYQWSWDCDYGTNGGYVRDCKATQLGCGFADGNTYLDNMWNVSFSFQIKKIYWPTFLCTGGDLVNYEKPSIDNNWRWTWNCQSKTGETISNGCYANKYRCGDGEGTAMTSETFLSRWSNSDYDSWFCPYGATKVHTVYNNYWECWTPRSNPGNQTLPIGKCKFSRTACGEAISEDYTYKTLNDNISADNGFLCSQGSTVSDLDCSTANSGEAKCSWACGDDYGKTLPNKCETNQVVCGNSNGKNILKVNFWKTDWFSPCNSNGTINPQKEDIQVNRKNGNGQNDYSTWYWYCQDSEGNNSDQCSANCTQGNNSEPCNF